MGIGNAIKFGAMGLAADSFAWHLTMGKGMFLGAIAGLFTPDAKDMGGTYEPDRFNTVSSRYAGFPMMEGLFGNTQGGPNDPAPTTRSAGTLAKAAALGVGAMLLSGGGSSFSLPLYGWAAGLMPYNTGGLMPLAWSNGLLPNWGWTAGFLT